MQGRHSKPSTTTTTVSASNTSATIPLSHLPVDIILSILKLLPVKSILRFKSVSKEWFSLLFSLNFITVHREETSKNPLNHSFLIHSIGRPGGQKMSLLNVNSTERERISLFNPFRGILKQMYLVGSINGLVCLSCPPYGDMIILWNPAMNLYKTITLLPRELRPDKEVHSISMGFAYDSLNDDYKIIRIARLMPTTVIPDSSLRSRAEVYSVNLDSWRMLPLVFHFVVFETRSNVIAKGIPYWTGEIYEASNQYEFSKILVHYDMRNGSFKHVPLPRILTHDDRYGVRFVEWKGNLGAIVSSPSSDREDFVDILVYDEMGMCWNQVSSHGPIGRKMEWPMQCSKGGLILAVTPEKELVLYDPLTNGIKTFITPEALELFFYEAISYTESLVTFKGMEQVKEQYKDNYSIRPVGVDVAAATDADGNVAAFFSFLNFCLSCCAYVRYWFISFALRIWSSVFTS